MNATNRLDPPPAPHLFDQPAARDLCDPSVAADLLQGVARRRILRRLHDLHRLLRRDDQESLHRVHGVLRELADRVAALQLTIAAAARRADGAVSCLRGAVLATAGGHLVSEFLLIPFGEVHLEGPRAGGSFTFTPRHAESAKSWFDGLGRKLALDYEHQSFDRFNTRADGLRPAAGWIGGLEIRDDGLWAVDVTWTERAAELLRAGEYRYFSPVIYWTDEERTDLAALGPVALTNDPAMRGVPALAAARRATALVATHDAPTDEPPVDDTPEAADDDAGETGGGQADPDRPTGDLAASAALDAARAEIAVLRRRLAAQAADEFVERGMRLGKILDSTSMDWRADYLRDAESTEERLARAPVLLPPGRILALNRRGQVEPLPLRERAGRRGHELHRRGGIEPEDLTAFERAQAEGRVVRG